MFKKSDKISRVQQKIVRDLENLDETAYNLPFTFSKPIRLSNFMQRVSSTVVYAGEKVYPVEVFTGELHIHPSDNQSKIIAVLHSDFESLANWAGKKDGVIIYGVKMDDGSQEKNFAQFTSIADFDINTKLGNYEVVGLRNFDGSVKQYTEFGE